MGIERERRYWSKVDKRGPSECWPWLASHNANGYGTFRGGQGEQLAHRYGWRLAYGPIPDGKIVCHTCDNPRCQNPNHWFIGTPKDNSDDKVRKGRQSHARVTGEKNGNSRLANDLVSQIVALAKSGMTQREIAELTGSSSRSVGKILRGEQWRHITNGESLSTPSRRSSGEGHHAAKLTHAIAADMRARYAAGDCSQQELADQYGVSQNAVSSVIRNRTWVTP